MKKSSAAGSSKTSKLTAKIYERPGVSSDEIQEIKQAFDLFDPEGTGTVNPRNLKSALDSLGVEAKNQTIYQMIADVDTSGTGTLTFDDFVHLMTSHVSDRDSRNNIKKIFSLFDEEKTGFLSIKNLRKIVRELGENIQEHELQEMIDKADLDHDGLISEQEFYLILSKKTTP